MDYMVYPRACAMAEALWLAPDKKNEGDFLRRLGPHMSQLSKEGVKLSWSHYRPLYTTNIVDHKPAIAVKPTTADKIVIEYIPAPLSGHPIKKAVIKPDSLIEQCTALKTVYKYKLITLPGSGKVVFYSGPNYIQKDTLNLNFSLSSGGKVKWITPPSSKSADAALLVDGMTDDNPFFGDRWVGFDSTKVEMEIDLGDVQSLSVLKISHRTEPNNHIYGADKLEAQISTDGINYTKVNSSRVDVNGRSISIRLPNQQARYVKFTITSNTSDKKARMLFDEISIN